MQKSWTKDLTLEQMVNIRLHYYQKDPIFNQQFPQFSIKDDIDRKKFKKSRPVLPKSAKLYYNKKRLPPNHQIESNFQPYSKAAKFIKISQTRSKINQNFDLAEEKLKEFIDDEVSLEILTRSVSPLRVSRYPNFPISKKLEKTLSPANSIQGNLSKQCSSVTLKRCKSNREKKNSIKKSFTKTFIKLKESYAIQLLKVKASKSFTNL